MLETFNVLRIDEPDFGCEGRPDGMEAVSYTHLRKE